MARAGFFDVVIDPNGRPIRGVSVAVYDTGTVTPYSGTIYAGPTAATTLPNPFTANDQGEVQFWTAAPTRVDLAYSKNGYTGETETVDTSDSGALMPDAQIPATIARDAEVTAAVGAEATLRVAGDAAEAAARAAAIASLNGTYGPIVKKVSTLTEPTYIAHRGGSLVAPENTLEAMRVAVAQGVPVIEFDTIVTRDHSLIVMHDEDGSGLDRTTTTAGNPANMSAASVQQLVVDAGAWFGYSWPNTLKVPLVHQIFTEFGTSVVYFPEVKQGDPLDLLALIQRHGLERSCLVNTFNIADLVPYTAAGISTLLFGDTLVPATVAAAGITHIGAAANLVDAAYVSSFTALGIKAWAYTIDRHYERDAALAKGFVGIISDDPMYAANRNKLSTDPFTSNTNYPGLQANNATKHKVSGGKLVLDSTGQFQYILQGWACPVANTSGHYKVTATITYDTVPADTTRWAGIAIGATSDHKHDDSSVYNNLYNVIVRASGDIAIFKRTGATPGTGTGGTNAQIGATLTTAPITAGNTAQVSVELTATEIIVTRIDTGHSRTVADTTHRGRYFHLGKSSGAFGCSFSGVTYV